MDVVCGEWKPRHCVGYMYMYVEDIVCGVWKALCGGYGRHCVWGMEGIVCGVWKALCVGYGRHCVVGMEGIVWGMEANIHLLVTITYITFVMGGSKGGVIPVSPWSLLCTCTA